MSVWNSTPTVTPHEVWRYERDLDDRLGDIDSDELRRLIERSLDGRRYAAARLLLDELRRRCPIALPGAA